MSGLHKIAPYLGEWVTSPEVNILVSRGRPKSDFPLTNGERQVKHRKKRATDRKRCIAVLDMETDPFDNVNRGEIQPFAACLYSDQFEPIIIWENDRAKFIESVVRSIEALPDRYTIYAHNGGKFDYMFFVSRLRGSVMFKGRGIMSARIGKHELRDSFNIIPEKLANYAKEKFDYDNMRRDRRDAHRQEIIDYLLSDCRYLFDIVRAFVDGYGLKLTIGQAAMYQLRKHYEVKKFSPNWDEFIRQFYFGGRVECLQGRGVFTGDYKLYDVNSMYPFVMATYQHPVGDMFDYKIRSGAPSNDTVFVDLEVSANRGGLVRRNDNNETSARDGSGRYFTTIWEYDMALRHDLLSGVRVNYSIDCAERTDFRQFVEPLYEKRLATKSSLADLKLRGLEGTDAFLSMKRDDIFYKLLLNNAYGKFAQNPRNFKEHWLTDPDQLPPDEWFKSLEQLPEEERDAYRLPHFEHSEYWIWCKPNPGFRFNNVGTAASITGAARAVLLGALHSATDAIYCDTDSIICRDLPNVTIDKTALGAWDIEDEFSEVLIVGKKLYEVRHKTPKLRSPEQVKRGMSADYTIKSKGVAGLNHANMLTMLAGASVETISFAPTLTRYSEQRYLPRRITATAPILELDA